MLLKGMLTSAYFVLNSFHLIVRNKKKSNKKFHKLYRIKNERYLQVKT